MQRNKEALGGQVLNTEPADGVPTPDICKACCNTSIHSLPHHVKFSGVDMTMAAERHSRFLEGKLRAVAWRLYGGSGHGHLGSELQGRSLVHPAPVVGGARRVQAQPETGLERNNAARTKA